MRNQTVEMSKGNYTQRVKIYGNDEIGELALAFNNLSKRVQEAQANTESEKRRLDSVITHMRRYYRNRPTWSCAYRQ